MMDTIGWFVTVNIVIICVTLHRCVYLYIDHLDNLLREDIRQFDIMETEEVREYN